MNPPSFDLVVLGGGSAGYAAARTVAAAGKTVAIVDGGAELGGLCILRGCMPTKALLYAAEVLHLRIGCDPVAPYYGTAPLKRASLTAGMLNAVESALSEVFELAPIGSQVVPMPEQPEKDSAELGRSFRGQRGRVLLRESVTVSAAGGPAVKQSTLR